MDVNLFENPLPFRTTFFLQTRTPWTSESSRLPFYALGQKLGAVHPSERTVSGTALTTTLKVSYDARLQ